MSTGIWYVATHDYYGSAAYELIERIMLDYGIVDTRDTSSADDEAGEDCDGGLIFGNFSSDDSPTNMLKRGGSNEEEAVTAKKSRVANDDDPAVGQLFGGSIGGGIFAADRRKLQEYVSAYKQFIADMVPKFRKTIYGSNDTTRNPTGASISSVRIAQFFTTAYDFDEYDTIF